jgi:DNA invertase Pin-like site-specific DNA recombinase
MSAARVRKTITDGEHRRAAVYVRISDDKVGEGAGVGRQEADCRALIDRHGWTVGEVYTENDVSAFRRRRVTLPDGQTAMRVVRPAFRRMLDDMQAGLVDALVAYDLDRIARDPRDLEDLIDVVEQRDVPTRTVTGSLDLSSDAGVTMSRVLLAMANKSSRDTSRRVARKHLELAEQGRVGGGGIRSYGYARDGLTVVEAEAEVLLEVAERIIGGESLTGIAASLTDRGVPTVRGGRWNARSVHSAITKGRVAGLREHRGEVVGPAVWPAILDPDTWAQVKLALEERSSGGTNQLRRWLTGILLCHACGRPLSGGTSNTRGRPRYWCKPIGRGRGDVVGGCGRTSISALPTEETVQRTILGYLTRPDIARELRKATGRQAVDHARADLEADERQLHELAEMWAARQVTTTEYLAARGPIEERIDHSNQLVRAALPGTVRRLLYSEDIESAWAALAPPKRREVARTVCPDGIRVESSPFESGGGRFDPDRLVFVGWD